MTKITVFNFEKLSYQNLLTTKIVQIRGLSPPIGVTQSNQNNFVGLIDVFKNEIKSKKFVVHDFERPFFRFKEGVILTEGCRLRLLTIFEGR